MREDRRFFERRRIERRRGVRLVVLAEEDFAVVAGNFLDVVGHPELLADHNGIAIMYHRRPRGAQAT